MKKIFSAFLLMTMMVASVGSFVSCSDIEESIAAVDEATKDNAASIKDLEGKIAALQTALQTAQSEAAAAKAEANAAKQAAATAKAEAIAAALAEIEKVNGDVDAVNAEIKKINDALAGCATKEAVELLQATIDEYKALIDANGDATTANAEAIAAIEEALAALGENVTPEQLAEVVAKMTAIDQALVAFQNRLQSVSYVPEWVDGPTAVLFEENEEYGYVHMSYEVAPAAYASKITAENTKLVGVALKGVEVEEHDVKILSADPETGIVEVIAYIGVDSEVWKAEKAAAVALRVVAEDAQFTSAYTNVNVIGTDKEISINDAVFFGTYNEDGEFTTGNITHSVAYDTAVAESEVALFEGLVARVNVPGFFEYVPVEEAAEMFGIEIEVTEKLSSYATKYFVTTNAKVYDFVKDAKNEKDTPAFVVANDQSLDITVKFNETVVDSLKKAETLPSYVGKTAKAELKPGFFQVNGKKSATFAGMTAYYTVSGLEESIELVVNNDEAINVEWTPENYTKKAALKIKDLDVTGGDARHLLGQTCEMKPVDEDGKVIASTTLSTPRVQVKFISVDNADVTVIMPIWPEENTTFNYTFEDTYEDAETAATVTTVKVTFDLAVAIEAAPEAIGEVPVVESLDVTLVKSGEKVEDPTKVATVIPFNGVVEKLLPYYKSYYETEKKAKAAIEAAIASKAVGIYVVNPTTGEMPETAQYQAVYTYKHETGKAEDSKITIPYNATAYAAMSEKYVRFAFDVNLFGVKSTVIADCAKVAKWVPYTVPTISLDMGKFNPETLKGANPFVWETIATQWTEMINGETVYHDYNYVQVSDANNSVKYYTFGGNALKLSDYVKIVNAPEGTDFTQYTIRVKMTSAPYYTTPDPNDATKTVKKYYYNEATGSANIPQLKVGASGTPYPLYVAATTAAAKVDAVAATETTPALNAVPAIKVGDNIAVYKIRASLFDNIIIDWNNSKVDAIDIQVDLVKAENTAENIERIKEIKSYPVKFRTPKTVTLETVETDAYEFVPGKDLKINLAKHIKVTDLFGNQVNNPYGTWAQMWNKYSWNKVTSNATADNYGKYVVGEANFFDVYGQEIKFVNLRDAEGKEISPATTIKNDNDFKAGDYTFENGVITLKGTLANISRETTFTVAVEFSHMNGGFKPEYKEITVKVVNAQ